MKNKIQGGQELELKFVDETRIYLNFWDSIHGNDICCQIKDGKIFKFVYLEDEIECEDRIDIQDPLEQIEISLNEFIELVQSSVLLQAE